MFKYVSELIAKSPALLFVGEDTRGGKSSAYIPTTHLLQV